MGSQPATVVWVTKHAQDLCAPVARGAGMDSAGWVGDLGRHLNTDQSEMLYLREDL